MPLALDPLQIADAVRGFALHHGRLWLGRKTSAADRRIRFEAYVRDELLERLGCPGAGIDFAGARTNPIVCFIDTGEGSGLVARCFERRLGKEKSREHAAVSRLVRDTGVDVPRLIFVDDSYRTLGRHRFDVVVEERVAGRHPRPEDLRPGVLAPPAPADTEGWTPERPERLEQLAEMLARLHGQTSPVPGSPWRRRHRHEPFIERFFVAREKPMLETAARAECLEARAEDLERLAGHLAARRATLDTGPPYSLVHGDLQPGNLVLRDDPYAPNIALIDFGTVHYGLWPWDFVVFHHGSGGDRALTRRLLDRYLVRRPQEGSEHFQRAWAYLLPWYHLEKSVSSLRKRARAAGVERAEAMRARAVQHFKRAVEVLDEPAL